MILTSRLTSTPTDSKGQAATSGGRASGETLHAPAWNRRPDSDFCSAATIVVGSMNEQRSTSHPIDEDCPGSSPALAPQIQRRQNHLPQNQRVPVVDTPVIPEDQTSACGTAARTPRQGCADRGDQAAERVAGDQLDPGQATTAAARPSPAAPTATAPSRTDAVSALSVTPVPSLLGQGMSERPADDNHPSAGELSGRMRRPPRRSGTASWHSGGRPYGPAGRETADISGRTRHPRVAA